MRTLYVLCCVVCVCGLCDLFSNLAVVVVLDLSKPEQMWDTLEILLKEVSPWLTGSWKEKKVEGDLCLQSTCMVILLLVLLCVWVCIYVYMCVCVCVCVCVCIYECVCVLLSMSVCVCVPFLSFQVVEAMHWERVCWVEVLSSWLGQEIATESMEEIWRWSSREQ